MNKKKKKKNRNTDKDGSGKISADELGSVMRAMGSNPTDEEVRSYFL